MNGLIRKEKVKGMSENKKAFNSLIENKRFENEGKQKLDKREILNELFFIRRQIDTLIEAVYELGVTDGQNKDFNEASLKLINSIDKDEKLPERVDEIERKEFIVSEEELNNLTFDCFDGTTKPELSEEDKKWLAECDKKFIPEASENSDELDKIDIETLKNELGNLQFSNDEQEDTNE